MMLDHVIGQRQGQKCVESCAKICAIITESSVAEQETDTDWLIKVHQENSDFSVPDSSRLYDYFNNY